MYFLIFSPVTLSGVLVGVLGTSEYLRIYSGISGTFIEWYLEFFPSLECKYVTTKCYDQLISDLIFCITDKFTLSVHKLMLAVPEEGETGW